jgi:hydroxymethylpyrimidine/phosphomethylpyrimidine kinase
MKTLLHQPPVVLAFSAHDPSGAAGVQADIESINRNGGRCVSVLTALTAQNTGIFESILPQPVADFRQQSRLLLADININAIKIGLIGSPALADEIADIIAGHPDLPVVFDPVLHAGSGAELATTELIHHLKQGLIPLTTVLTPNLKEAQRLTGVNDKDQAAQVLLQLGCRSVLITGADQATDRVINSLYQADTAPIHFDWERLPGIYHGSGCTLAAAIAAQLAQNKNIVEAVDHAQQYSWYALKHGIQLGKSQLHPDRNYQD